jgi:hypothetical protein
MLVTTQPLKFPQPTSSMEISMPDPPKTLKFDAFKYGATTE